MKKLNEIINKFNIKNVDDKHKNILISGITQDSRVVKKNYIFLIKSGKNTDGINYIKKAIENGAVVIFSEKNISNISVPVIIVENIKEKKNAIAQFVYDNPEQKMKIIGITGTNGKTTAAFFLKGIIENTMGKCGMIGTTGHYKSNEIEFAYNTTPPAIEITRLFGEMINKGIQTVVIEVSSYALAIGRVNNIKFDGVIFTSFEREHLELHNNIEDYLNAKLLIFSLLKENGFICINEEIEKKYLNKILKYSNNNTFLYSKKRINDMKIDILELNKNNSNIRITKNKDYENIKIYIPGVFNILNVLAAISAGIKIGFHLCEIKRAIEETKYIPGRMEKINIQKPYDIFIDYAHSKEGLENVLSSMRELKIIGKLIVVFGCGGDRDFGKRSLMGEVAERYADIVILTSDNPRSEEPIEIIKNIESGMKSKTPIVEVNRKEAIEYAIKIAEKGDILLICGKGHETYQEKNGKRINFNDKEIVKKFLNIEE